MNNADQDFQTYLFSYFDRMKELLSPDVWQNILLDCSKNEMLVLWLLYRKGIVNMSQIAEYLSVPLNTATGIVGRMEKKELILRERSPEDKRIVTIHMGRQGNEQMQKLVSQFMYYGQKILEEFTPEEIKQFVHMLDKLMDIVTEQRDQEPKSKVRKIQID